MRLQKSLVVATLVVASMLGACSSTVTARPELVSAGVSAPVVQGKATVVMPTELLNRTVSARPTSFTGGGTTLNVPIGEVLRTTAAKVMSAGFSDGAVTAEQAAPGSYAVILGLDQFSYAYDQASNLGFAITPKVTVGVVAEVQDPAGKALFSKTYTKADFSSGKYVASTQPAEKINEGLHLALGQIFRELLDDIATSKAD
jgi:hypothetical protein